MRKTLNISVSEDMLETIHRQVRKGYFSSVSDYFRSLVRRDLIGTLEQPSLPKESFILKKANDYFDEFYASQDESKDI